MSQVSSYEISRDLRAYSTGFNQSENGQVEEVVSFIETYRERFRASDMASLTILRDRMRQLKGSNSQENRLLEAVLAQKDSPQVAVAREALYDLFSILLDREENAFDRPDFCKEVQALWGASFSPKLLASHEAQKILEKAIDELKGEASEIASQIRASMVEALAHAREGIAQEAEDSLLIRQRHLINQFEAEDNPQLEEFERDSLDYSKHVSALISFASAMSKADDKLSLSAKKFLLEEGNQLYKTMEEKFPYLKKSYPALMARVLERLRFFELAWNPFTYMVDELFEHLQDFLGWKGRLIFSHTSQEMRRRVHQAPLPPAKPCKSIEEYEAALVEQSVKLKEVPTEIRIQMACQGKEKTTLLSLRHCSMVNVDLNKLLEECPNLEVLDLRDTDLAVSQVPFLITHLKYIGLPKKFYRYDEKSLKEVIGLQTAFFSITQLNWEGKIHMGDVLFDPLPLIISHIKSHVLKREWEWASQLSLKLTGNWDSEKFRPFFSKNCSVGEELKLSEGTLSQNIFGQSLNLADHWELGRFKKFSSRCSSVEKLDLSEATISWNVLENLNFSKITKIVLPKNLSEDQQVADFLSFLFFVKEKEPKNAWYSRLSHYSNDDRWGVSIKIFNSLLVTPQHLKQLAEARKFFQLKFSKNSGASRRWEAKDLLMLVSSRTHAVVFGDPQTRDLYPDFQLKLEQQGWTCSHLKKHWKVPDKIILNGAPLEEFASVQDQSKIYDLTVQAFHEGEGVAQLIPLLSKYKVENLHIQPKLSGEKAEAFARDFLECKQHLEEMAPDLQKIVLNYHGKVPCEWVHRGWFPYRREKGEHLELLRKPTHVTLSSEDAEELLDYSLVDLLKSAPGLMSIDLRGQKVDEFLLREFLELPSLRGADDIPRLQLSDDQNAKILFTKMLRGWEDGIFVMHHTHLILRPVERRGVFVQKQSEIGKLFLASKGAKGLYAESQAGLGKLIVNSEQDVNAMFETTRQRPYDGPKIIMADEDVYELVQRYPRIEKMDLTCADLTQLSSKAWDYLCTRLSLEEFYF